MIRHARVDAVIGRFNQFNYAGSLLGAVMIGLAGAGNLRIGFAVPMVLVLGILPLARGAFAPSAHALHHPADRPRSTLGGPGQFLSGCGTGRPGCSPPRASR